MSNFLTYLNYLTRLLPPSKKTKRKAKVSQFYEEFVVPFRESNFVEAQKILETAQKKGLTSIEIINCEAESYKTPPQIYKEIKTPAQLQFALSRGVGIESAEKIGFVNATVFFYLSEHPECIEYLIMNDYHKELERRHPSRHQKILRDIVKSLFGLYKNAQGEEVNNIENVKLFFNKEPQLLIPLPPVEGVASGNMEDLGYTPEQPVSYLLRAIYDGNCEVIQLLIKKGVDIHAGSVTETRFTIPAKWKITPFTEAVASNNNTIIEIFLNANTPLKDIELFAQEIQESKLDVSTQELWGQKLRQMKETLHIKRQLEHLLPTSPVVATGIKRQKI